MAVHTDVRDATARPTIAVQSSNVSGTPTASMATSTPQPVRQLHHACDGILAAVVDRQVGAELERLLEPRVGEVDRDDVARREELRRHDRREPDRAGTDDRDRVTGLHAAVQHADLECGREDVGEEQRRPRRVSPSGTL